MGEPLSAPNLDLAEMLEQAEALIKRHDDLSQKRTKLETKLATAQSERADRRALAPDRRGRVDRLAN